MSFVKFLFVILFLIPAVSALSVDIQNNKLTINGEFSSIVNIYYEDNSELIDVIDFKSYCGGVICNGRYSYDLNRINLKLDESYYFNVYDYNEKKTKRFNFGFRATGVVIGKGLYEQCNLDNECASGNCANMHCCPIDKECYLNNKCYDVGEFTSDKNYVCSSLSEFKSCNDYCSEQGLKCVNGECVEENKLPLISAETLKCSDGTLIGECSSQKPKYCSYNNENLIRNGDFEIEEINKKTLPQYWQETSSQNTVYNIEYSSFGKVFSIEQKEQTNKWIGAQNEIPLKSNTLYKLSAFVYCQDCFIPQDFSLAVHVRPKTNPTTNFYCKNGNCNDEFKLTPNYLGGYTLETTFTTNNEENLYGYIIATFIPNSKGKAYIDNITLTEVNPQLVDNCEVCSCDEGKRCENGRCVVVISKIISSGEIDAKTFEYLKEENKPLAKPILGANDFYANSLPAEKHPVVLYKDINVIKNRITREPYLSWWNQINWEASWIIGYDISKFNRIQKARYAKIMAFEYAVTKEEKYGDKARDLLLNMNDGNYDQKHFEDIDSLAWFAEAYDMLKGANYNFEKVKFGQCSYECNCKKILWWKYKCKTCYNCERNIREDLKGQMKQVAETTLLELGGDTLTRLNNHHIRRYSAVGLTALVLHDNEFFTNAMEGGTTFGVIGDVLDFAMDFITSFVSIFSPKTAANMETVRFSYNGLDEPLNNQIIDESGGWREGPHYLMYSFTTGIPFMKAMENSNVANDWLQVGKLRNSIINWAEAISMPNGAMPPIDDSNLGTSYSPTGYLGDKNGNWLWAKNYFTFSDESWAKIDSIAYYDDSVGKSEPDLKPTQYLGSTGIFFRSNWGKDAVYLGFLGENNRAIDNELLGVTHEHTDTMSFILYAYGKYLALDSGYIDWDNKARVANPKNHNVILINNGLASEGNPIESDFFSTDYLDYGKIKNSMGHERGILFVDKNYFLVFDVLKSNLNRNYDWLLHGNGLDSNFKIYELGKAEWSQDDVGLLAYVLPRSNDVINFKEGEHCNIWPDVEKHTYMDVLRNGENMGFLSLLYPSKGRNYPETNKIGENILEIKKDDWKGLAFVNENNNLIELNGIKTDASRFFVKFKDDKIDYLFADDVTEIYLNNEKLIKSDVKTTIAIKFVGDNMEINYKDNGNIVLNKKPAEVLYNDRINNNLISNNGVSL